MTGSRVGPENTSNLTSLRPRDGAYHERFVEFLRELVVSHGCKSSLEAITEAGVRLSFRSL
jgi:hypothetical protein